MEVDLSLSLQVTRNIVFLCVQAENMRHKLPIIYHPTLKKKNPSVLRQQRFETGAIRSDKAVGEPRGFP